MQTTLSPDPWHQECLGKLQQLLDLAMHTAAAASTEGNHKIVLQAVREATRIITLMTKMTAAPSPEKRSGPKVSPRVEAQADALEGLLGDLSALTEEIGRSFPIENSGPDLGTSDCLPKTGDQLFPKREKGGKVPGKTSCLADFFKKNKRPGKDQNIPRTGS
jgi:hypothetical protein